jgi:hypothetical protein
LGNFDLDHALLIGTPRSPCAATLHRADLSPAAAPTADPAATKPSGTTRAVVTK